MTGFEDLILYAVLGASAGLLAGLLGIGGGLIIVPVLAWYFALAGFPAEYLMHYVLATSLATIIPTSMASTWGHYRHGKLDWALLLRFVPGLMAGSLTGALVADQLSSQLLRVFFGIYALVVAAQLLRRHTRREGHGLPPTGLVAAVSFLIGLISALVGIGGGSMTVPFLLWGGLVIQRAVAISAAAGFPIAIAAVAGFIWSGDDVTGDGIGYVYLPAALMIALFSVPAAPLGARLAHWLPADILRRVFAFFMLVVGLKMLGVI